MKNCPKCQSSVSDTAKFCVKCGFNIKKYEEENAQEEYFCSECGTKFSGGTFCPECGYNVAKDLGEKAELAMDDTLSIDFSAISQAASEQLFEKEGFTVENSVLMGYNGNKRSIVIHDVEEIYDGAFKDNQIVTFVEIKEGVKIIGKKAFADCGSLVKINIPASVEKIYDDAFEGVDLEMLILPEFDKRLVDKFLPNAMEGLSADDVSYEDYIESKGNTILVNIKELSEKIKKKALLKEEMAKWEIGGNPIFGKYLDKPIEWRVLDKNDNKALIISRNCICTKQFHNMSSGVTWWGCTLRKWLNDEFIRGSFNETEQNRILTTHIETRLYTGANGNATEDRVFLLNIDEARKYFAYDEQRASNSYWWLRSPAKDPNYASFVEPSGKIRTDDVFVVSYTSLYVRPALWVDLSFLSEK